MAARKIKFFSVFALAVFAVLVFAPHAVLAADQADVRAECSFSGTFTSGMSCNTSTDVTINMSQVSKVEILTDSFDDYGTLEVTAPNNTKKTIASSKGCPTIGTIPAGDITYLFNSAGVHTVHVTATDDPNCGTTVGVWINLRITYKGCSGPNALVCNTPPADNKCLINPGRCVVVNGAEACQYTASADKCDADGDSCTIDYCQASADGSTASCIKGPNTCGGLVPCGRLADNPATPDIDETKACGLCSFLPMASNVVDFLMSIVALLTLLALVVGGIIYIKTAGDVSLISAAKQNFGNILQGFVMVFLAWLIVNTLLVLFGFNTFMGGNWAKFTCNF